MPKFGPSEYLTEQQYKRVLDHLHGVMGLLLFEFANAPRNVRDTIIRNFIARADVATRSIFSLWTLKDYQGCWILHRALLDRLFHLRALSEGNSFAAFEAWSFLHQYKAVERVRSEPDFSASGARDFFTVSEAQRDRANALLLNPPQWQRPRAETVAKEMQLGILYRFGYDHASMHVHPMADDGNQDFYTITGLTPAPSFPHQIQVVSNTLLTTTLLVTEGLNGSSLAWRGVVYAFLEEVREYLINGDERYISSFAAIAAIAEAGAPLAESRED